MPAEVGVLAHDQCILRAHLGGVRADQRMALKAACHQLPVDLAPGLAGGCGAGGGHASRRYQLRMLTARATTSPIVTSAVSDWALISHLAIAVSGIVSVGLNAVALVNDV